MGRPRSQLYECHLLEVSAYDGNRVQAQPLFRQGGVKATEIVIGRQVALNEIARFQRRIGPIHSPVHPVSDGEGRPGRSVVGASAVVADAAPKLAEQHDDDLFRGAVLTQVREEVSYGNGNVHPEFGM